MVLVSRLPLLTGRAAIRCHRCLSVVSSHSPLHTNVPSRQKLLQVSQGNAWNNLVSSHGSQRFFMSSITSWFSKTPPPDSEGGATTSSTGVSDVEYIPEPPTGLLSEPIPGPELVLNHLGEPTFASLGLGGYWPTGWVESGFELLHVTFDMPWWQVVVLATGAIRLLTFPMLVLNRRQQFKMAECMPVYTKLQEKQKLAKLTNNSVEEIRIQMELQAFKTKSGFSVWRQLVYSSANLPIMITFFLSLRHMASVPVVSMQEGGLFWFQDLTMADPYFLLPLISMSTLLVMMELGIDVPSSDTMGSKTKWAMRAVVPVTFLFIMNQPAVLAFYWSMSNLISLLLTGVLKLGPVRDTLGLPDPVLLAKIKAENKAREAGTKSRGFKEKMKIMMDDQRIESAIKNRGSNDDRNWKNAATGPLIKTFKYDPTKVKKKIES